MRDCGGSGESLDSQIVSPNGEIQAVAGVNVRFFKAWARMCTEGNNFYDPFVGCSCAESTSVSRNEKNITCIIDKSNRNIRIGQGVRNDRTSRKGSVSSFSTWAASMPARLQLGQPIHFSRTRKLGLSSETLG